MVLLSVGVALAASSRALAGEETLDLLLPTGSAGAVELPVRALAGLVRSGRVNAGAFNAARLQIALPDGTTAVARRDREARRGVESLSWVGHFESEPGSVVVLTSHRGVITGYLRRGAEAYELSPQADGEHTLARLDESELPGDVLRYAPAELTESAPPDAAPAGAEPYAAGTPGYVHDLLVVYTSASRSRYGQTALESRIISAVEMANQAYRNSRVNVLLNIAHMAEVNYTETGDLGVALERLQRANDGHMDTVHQLRNQYGADLVALVGEDDTADGTLICGVGYIMTVETTGFAGYAFSAVPSDCLSNQALAHEIGHNQGSAHDRATATANDEGGGVFPYSYGYRRCAGAGTSFVTIMAYKGGCQGAALISHFSNPDVDYNGYPTGIDHEADPANSADNARSLNNTADTVAAFRAGNGSSPPANPSGLAATAISAQRIDLSWTDNATNESGYRLERSADGAVFAEIAIVGANKTSYSSTGLAAGTWYWYRVRAYNSAGNSGYSNEASAQTFQAGSPPNAPTNLLATALTGTSVGLSWNDNSSNESGFRVQRWTGSAWQQIADPGANTVSYTDAGLSTGTPYQYRAYAYNASGNSGYSNTATVTTPGPPPAPSHLTAVAVSASSIRLTWTDNSVTELGFRIQRRSGVVWQQIAAVAAGSEAYVDGDLAAGTFYEYRVYAYNDEGVSAFSNTASATTVALLSAPGGLSATTKSASAIRLAWTDTSGDESGFQLERRVNDAWAVVATLPADATAYTDADLAADAPYVYRVRAYDSRGFSASSGEAAATTGAGPRPLPARSGRDITALDQNGDGIGDVAALADNGRNRVRLLDGLTGEQIRSLSFLTTSWLPVGVATVLDTNGDAAPGDPSISLLAHNPASEKHLVQTRRADTGALVRNIHFLGSSWQVVDVAVVNDTDGDGVGNDPAIAVLGFKPSTGKTLVQVRRLSDRGLITNRSFFSEAWTPLALAAVARPGGAAWLGVLAVRSGSDGEIMVQSRRLSDGTLRRNTTFLNSWWMVQDLAIVADLDGNPASDDPAWAVLATNPATGRQLAQLRRVTTGELVKNIDFLTASWRLLALSAVDDVNGNGRPEIGVLAEDRSESSVRVRLADVATRETVRDVSVPAAAKTDQWHVLLSGGDDGEGYLEINGRRVADCPAGGNPCDLDIREFLQGGANIMRLVVERTGSGGTGTFQYHITQNGATWAYGFCGSAPAPACPLSGVPGIVLDRSFIVAF